MTGECRTADQPQTLPTQRVPEGQCSLTTHCTQVWLTVSQRFCGAAPPSVGPPLGAQPSSLRQPGSQVLVAPLQCSVAGQVSLLATH